MARQTPGLFHIETPFPRGPLANCFSTPWLSKNEYASTSPTPQRSKSSEEQFRLNSTTPYKRSSAFLKRPKTYCFSFRFTFRGPRGKPRTRFPEDVGSRFADG